MVTWGLVYVSQSGYLDGSDEAATLPPPLPDATRYDQMRLLARVAQALSCIKANQLL